MNVWAFIYYQGHSGKTFQYLVQDTVIYYTLEALFLCKLFLVQLLKVTKLDNLY